MSPEMTVIDKYHTIIKISSCTRALTAMGRQIRAVGRPDPVTAI